MRDSKWRDSPTQARIRDALAGNVRTARIDAGLTQMELAAAVGSHHSVISRLENGIHRCTVGQAALLASAMGVSVIDLVDGCDV